MLTPEFWSAPSTWDTVAAGLRDRRTAQAPATCGVAMEVPRIDPKPAPGTDEVITEPGASRLRNGAVFEKLEIASVRSSVDPTLTAVEMQPGALNRC